MLIDEPMHRHCTWRVGGPADAFVQVSSTKQMSRVLAISAAMGVPVFLLGGGSNILVSDRGFRGLVVQNRVRNIETLIEAERPAGPLSPGSVIVRAEAGAWLSELVKYAANRHLTGLEWAVGIPGTVGGAIVGNAGAFGSCLADCLCSVSLRHLDGDIGRVRPGELAFGYRTSLLKGSRNGESAPVVLAGEFALQPGDPAEIERLTREYQERRRQSQPKGASAGSVFKNTTAGAAGKLVEQAGLKGRREGGAEISPQHANFIVNREGATAADIRSLIELAQQAVAEKCGVCLELEIELVGDWN